MKVEILENGTFIGTAELTDLDPPMGVAWGRFTPTDDYRRETHANLIDGEIVGDKSRGVEVRSQTFGSIEHGGISIHDIQSVGEIEITFFSIPYPQYETYFGENPQYRAYWSEDN